MNNPRQPPSEHSIMDEAWSHVVGSMDWLKSVFIGEFADNRPLSAVIADMLVSFLPGVVIVTSARDAVAVILRMASDPKRREDLMEWILLCSCLIVIALPLAMAAGGAAFAGAGAIVGGIAGSELGAALRALMLLLIKKASTLIETIQFLQKFMKGDILKFLNNAKFVQYEKPLIEVFVQVNGKLIEIIASVRGYVEGLQNFDRIKGIVAGLAEWEKRFYGLQQDGLTKIPQALAEIDVRLAHVLAQGAPTEAHTVAAGVHASKITTPKISTRRVDDATSNGLFTDPSTSPPALQDRGGYLVSPRKASVPLNQKKWVCSQASQHRRSMDQTLRNSRLSTRE